VGDDTVSNIGVTATTSGKNAGTYTNTVFDSAAVKNNYANVTETNGQLDISKNTLANVVLTANSGTAVYNGMTQSVTGLASAIGLVGDDTVSNIGVTATTSGKNAGTYTNTVFDSAAVKNNYANVTETNGQLDISKNTLANVVLTANSLITTFNGSLQSVSGLSMADGLVGNDNVNNIGVIAVTSGVAAGVYTDTQFTNLAQLQSNYQNITTINGTLTIDFNGVIPPTPPETYTRISSDIVNLAPVSFAVGIAPATASGEDDPNICYAWNQRGSGSVAVLSVLQPSYLGLRNAKTDNQEALSNGNGSDNDAGSPCLNDLRTSLALAGPF
jgi:uncharacterized alkaline shock family protein YloU